MNTGFVIGPNDKGVLKKYLNEFQDGDWDVRVEVVGKALGEIYRLRPDDTPFGKKEATEVCIAYSHMRILLIQVTL